MASLQMIDRIWDNFKLVQIPHAITTHKLKSHEIP
jgi:hypothetical protein